MATRTPKPITRDAKALALADLAEGRTLAEVRADLASAGFNVSDMTLSRWRRSAAEAAAREPRKPAPPPAPAITPESLADLVRGMVQDAQQGVAEARETGNTSVAARFGRTLADLAKLLARLDRDAKTSADAIVITPAQLAALDDNLRERIRAALERPLLCAHCSKQLSIDWSGVSPEEYAGQ